MITKKNIAVFLAFLVMFICIACVSRYERIDVYELGSLKVDERFGNMSVVNGTKSAVLETLNEINLNQQNIDDEQFFELVYNIQNQEEDIHVIITYETPLKYIKCYDNNGQLEYFGEYGEMVEGHLFIYRIDYGRISNFDGAF